MIWTIISFPFWVLGHLVRLVFPGDSGWTLRDYELKLIEAAARNLSEENREILAKQLARMHYIERLHEGRIVHIHFELMRNRIERLHLPENYNLARLKVKSAGGAAWVTVGAFQGLIFSISCSQPPKPIFVHPFAIVEEKLGHEGDDIVARRMDRLEHGDGTQADEASQRSIP